MNNTTSDREPRSGNATKEAILDAASQLFAVRRPSQVTIREIASRAGVNHALVHRHFGTKESLVRAVIRSSASEYADAVSNYEDPAEAFRQGFLFAAQEHPGMAAIAGAIFDEAVTTNEPRSFPPFERYIRLLDEKVAKTGVHPRHSPPVIAAAAFAFMSGWFILEDWLVRATGLEGRDIDRLREEMATFLKEIVEDAAAFAESPKTATVPKQRAKANGKRR